MHLGGPGPGQLGGGDPAAAQRDAGQPGPLRSLHVPDRVADDDRARRVQPVVAYRHLQQVRPRLGRVHVRGGGGAGQHALGRADRRHHPVQVVLLAAGRQHHPPAAGGAGGEQLGRPREGGHLVAQRLVPAGVRVHGVLVGVAEHALHQLLAADADGPVQRPHAHVGVPGVPAGLRPGEDVQVVGVQQGAVDVEEHARREVRSHLGGLPAVAGRHTRRGGRPAAAGPIR